jgi:hypothetical protein
MRWQFGVAAVLGILVAPAAARADWVTVVSAEGHFTALMPVWPTLETRTENADDGSIIGIGHLFRAEDTDYGLLCVAVDAVSSEPVSAPDSLLTGKFTGNLRLRERSLPRSSRRKACGSGISRHEGSAQREI